MAYLIDGNNLLGRIAAHELRDRTGRDGLVVRLLAFQRVTRTRIYLVFDGRPDDDRTVVPVNPKFTILFPEPGGTADDVIHAMIEGQTDRRRFFVVSSDREVREFARSHGLTPVTSDVFAQEMKQAIREGKKRRELDKRTEPPSSLEVDLWKEVFKSKP